MENFETGVVTDCEADDCENYSSLVTYLTSAISQIMSDTDLLLKGYEYSGMSSFQVASNLSRVLFEQFDKENEVRGVRLETFRTREHEEAYVMKSQASARAEFELRQREREARNRVIDEVIKNNQAQRERENQEWLERGCLGLNVYEEYMRERSGKVTA